MKSLYVSGPRVLYNSRRVFAVDTENLVVVWDNGYKHPVREGDTLAIVDRGKLKESYKYMGGKWVTLKEDTKSEG